MNLRSLLQDILNEVSSRIISFQIELHLLITWVRSSSYFKFKESLRTCSMASQFAADGTVESLRSYIWRSFLIVSSYPIRSLRNLGNVSEVPTEVQRVRLKDFHVDDNLMPIRSIKLDDSKSN